MASFQPPESICVPHADSTIPTNFTKQRAGKIIVGMSIPPAFGGTNLANDSWMGTSKNLDMSVKPVLTDYRPFVIETIWSYALKAQLRSAYLTTGTSNSLRALRLSISIAAFFFTALFAGCNGGLAPTQSSSAGQMGFGGTVRFVSAWPPSDSVQDLRVVAFYKYPPTNILTEVTNGQALVYPIIGAAGLPKFVDSLSYKFNLDSAAAFEYVAVALQYGSNVFQDWKVVGAYGYSHGVGQPDSVVVTPGSFVNGIDIDVDFKNTPPNPLGSLASPSVRH